MAKRLSDKQKKLAEGLANGMSQMEAYIAAGYSANTAQSNASVTIDNLWKNMEFEKYYNSLIKPTEKRRKKSVDDLQEYWSDVIDNPDTSTADKLKASEFIAKTHGLFISKQQTELTLNGSLADVLGAVDK